MLDIGPRRNNGAEDHQTKREEYHGRNRSAKPEDLSVGDEDDCQVLEDCVYRDGEKLQRLCARVDHTDEEERDWEPYPRISTSLLPR